MIALLGTTAKTLALYACLNGNCYIIDYGLTGEDCRRAMRLGVLSVITETGKRESAAGYKLSCRPDRGSN